MWSFGLGGWLFLKKTFVEHPIFSKWLIYIPKALIKGFLTRYCTNHEIEYFQNLLWNTVYIVIITYILFSVSRSQSQLRINYPSEQVTSNKWSLFQWISSDGKFETILHSAYTAEARTRNGLEHRLAFEIFGDVDVVLNFKPLIIFVWGGKFNWKIEESNLN